MGHLLTSLVLENRKEHMKIAQKNFFVAGLVLISGLCFGQDPNCVYLASDVYPGTFGSLPGGYTEYNGAIYFSATGNGDGVELWKYQNGVSSIVADINPGLGGSMPNHLTVMGADLYFSASTATSGNELFKYDGTTVTMVADINAGPMGSFPNTFRVIGSVLYFVANDGISGVEPWKYDGVTASLVADINPGANSSGPQEIIGFGGNVYYTASSDLTGEELWKYNGSTITLIDILPGIQGSDIGELRVIPGKLCFRATDGVLGYELFTYDGTNLVNLDVNPAGDFTPWELTVVGNDILFRGFMGGSGYELWKYNGTSATLVMDIRPGNPNSNPNNLTAVGNTLYFAANDGVNGNELWKYDGTTPVLVADLKPGSAGSMPAPSYDPFGVVGNNVFMVAENGSSGYEVWGYDGTSLVLGKDIMSGTGTSTPTSLKGIGDLLYFTADNSVNGGEIWIWNPDAELSDSISVYTCGNYTSPAGTLYTGEGVYDFVDVIPSVTCPGCDSLITVNLTITTQPASYDTVVACNSYTSPGGTVYSTNGDYTITEVVPSQVCSGVDSTINIELTLIDEISTAIVVFSGVILVQQSGANYQWLDCDAGFAPIPGAIEQDFLPASDGNYACQISIGSCSDTTNCAFVDIDEGVGFDEETKNNLSFYPNPVSDMLTITSTGSLIIHVKIVNSLGDTVSMVNFEGTNEVMLNLNTLSRGVYFVMVETPSGWLVERITKQ